MKIFVTSQSFKENIVNRDVPTVKVVYWPQYAEEFYKPLKRKEEDNDDIFRVMFTGNIGEAQGLTILPKLARRLKESGADKRVKFTLIGDGRSKDDLIKLIENESVSDMFEFISKKPPSLIPLLLSNADVAFLSFSNNDLFKMTIPAKLQSYMACGKPIFAIADGETKKVIDESESGLCSKPSDFESAYNNLLKFCKMDDVQLKEMSLRALTYSKTHFDKIKLIEKMEEYFN